jgi:hypothetical protein
MSLSIGIVQRDFGYFKRVAGNVAGFLRAVLKAPAIGERPEAAELKAEGNAAPQPTLKP